MATEIKPGRKRTPRGNVRFEMQRNGKTVAVHVDRTGFRRLLETLERLAETGERQTFGKSGRNPANSASRKVDDDAAIARLVFHIDDAR